MAIGAFVTSTMGMQAQTHALDQISSNIANVQTVGYKKVDALFETHMTVYNQMSADKHSFSANNVDRRMVDVSGFLNTTNSIYDLGISGKGFFVVEGDNQTLYSRAGDFQATAVTPNGYSAKTITYNKPSSAGVVTQSDAPAYLINGSGYYVMGWNYNAASEAFSSSMEPVVITPMEYYQGHVTTEMSFKGNIRANSDDPQQLKFAVYDSEYSQHNMVMNWEKTSANNWLLTISVDGAKVDNAPIEVQFDGNAKMITPSSNTVLNVAWDKGGSSTIDIDLSKITQYANNLSGEVLSQDGKPFGSLTGREWDSEGVLHATYSNGAKIPICKVAVAHVQVPNNMEAVSGNMFAYNQYAGNLEIIDLQNTRTETTVEGGKLESSNVQLEEEFSNMIITQRAYSGNTKTFSTVNEMIQEAISILT